MTFNEYQIAAGYTDISPAEIALTYHTLGLTNEAGEVAGKIKKIFRDNNGELSPEKKHEIAHELGDVQWYLARLAADIGYTLESIAAMNIDKLADRKERNKLGGSGDHR